MSWLLKYYRLNWLSTRAQYWGTLILNYFASMFLLIVGAVFSNVADGLGAIVGIPLVLTSLVSYFWIHIANIYRRCCDAGVSPWFAWLIIVPLINFIFIVVLGCLPSKSK